MKIYVYIENVPIEPLKHILDNNNTLNLNLAF